MSSKVPARESSPSKPKADKVELYADILAHVQYFPTERRQHVLERLLGDASTWKRIAAEGSASLSDRAITERFSSRLAESKRRLKAAKARIEDLGPLGSAASEPIETTVEIPLDQPVASKVGVAAPPLRHLTAEEVADIDETVVLPLPMASPPAARSVSPASSAGRSRSPEPAPPRPHPWLSLEQYAALRAATATATTDATVARARAHHGLDEQSDRAELEAWNRRFEDPHVFAEYMRLFALKRGRGGE